MLFTNRPASSRTVRPRLETLEARITPAYGYALTATNSLLRFDTDFPAVLVPPLNLTGIAAGETLVGIDIRPQNGHLYGLGYNSAVGSVTLYDISPRTATAKAIVPATPNQFVDTVGNPLRIGVDATTTFGVDFNPVADRLRVVTSNGQNFRLNPNTGAYVSSAAGMPQPDIGLSGATTTVDETAYTNSVANTAVTTQYTISSVTDSLYVQGLTGSTPAGPNGGVQGNPTPITLGGTPLNFTSAVGFDILGNNASTGASNDAGSGFARAVLTVGGVTSYYEIDIASGAATLRGTLGAGTTPIRGVTFDDQTDTSSLRAIALSGDGASLLRFPIGNPGSATTQAVAVASLAAGEVLVGIDYRPSTGQLYGLAVNAATDTGTLYLVDPQTGALTRVGATSGLIAFAGTDLPTGGYGVNFNPVADRIRVVTGTGLNFRIDPNTGTATLDTPLSGLPAGSTGVQGTSYTDSFGGATRTTQYTLDGASNSLFIQNPPNTGTQTTRLALTDGTTPLDFAQVIGFDIAPSVDVAASGSAAPAGDPTLTGRSYNAGYAALSDGTTTTLYRINLGSGRISSVGAIASASGIVGLTLGDNLDFSNLSFATGSADVDNLGSNPTDGFSVADASMVVNGVRFRDAYDTALAFRVNGVVFNPGDVVDQVRTVAGIRATSGSVVLSGLTTTQEITFFDATSTLRNILTLTNSTGAAVTLPVQFFGDLGSDSDTVVVASGNTPGVGLRWAVSDDQTNTPDTGDPALSFVFGGPGAQVPASGTAYGAVFTSDYRFTIQPGQTVRILTFAELFGPRAPALARSAIYDSVSAMEAAGLFAGIDAATRDTIVNFNFAPATANAGGPYSVQTGSTVGLMGSGTAGSTFEWDFNYDGVTFRTAATGATPAFSATGIPGGTVRTVAVRATAPNSLTAIATSTVTVTAVPVVPPAPPVVVQAAPEPSSVISAENGQNGTIQVRGADSRPLLSITPFAGYTGAISTATGDITGDGIDDVVVGVLGGDSHVKVFDGATGSEIRSFYAFGLAFKGGVTVGTMDLDADGIADIVLAAGPGGGPHVRVVSGKDGSELASFLAYDVRYSGGVTVSTGDVTGDGIDDLVTGARGSSTHVKVFSGRGLSEVRSFYAFDPSLIAGVNVAVSAGRIVAGIETGGPLSGASEVRVIDSTGKSRSLIPYADFRGSVRVSVNGEGRIVTGAGPGGGPHVRTFDPTTLGELESYFAFDPAYRGGIYVG